MNPTNIYCYVLYTWVISFVNFLWIYFKVKLMCKFGASSRASSRASSKASSKASSRASSKASSKALSQLEIKGQLQIESSSPSPRLFRIKILKS